MADPGGPNAAPRNVAGGSGANARLRTLDARMRHRTTYLTHIDRIADLSDQGELGAATMVVVKNMAKILEVYWQKFESEHMQIIAHPDMTEEMFDEQDPIYVNAHERMFLAKNAIDARIDQLAPQMPEAQVAQPEVRVEVNANDLPTGQVTWGKFNGDHLS